MVSFFGLREVNPKLEIGLNTNGSARTEKWWGEMANVLGDNGYVVFSIDGDEETNHIYRRYTDYNKIIRNAKTREEILLKCNAEYLVDGLKSLCEIKSNSLDFVFSHSVLEHIRKNDFISTILELKTILTIIYSI